MSYTPAPGNAANFDFTVGGYVPPAGNGSSFQFSTGSSGTGAVLGKAVVAGVSADFTRSQGSIAGQSALSGISVAGSHGMITGRVTLTGVGVEARSATATILANAVLTGVGHALGASAGSAVGHATLSGVSQTGFHGSIAGQAQLSGVGLARRFVTGAGGVHGKTLLCGFGLGANALKVLLATRQFVMADLFTITLARTGQNLRFTDADRPVWWNNTFYDPYSIAIDGLQFKKSVGLSVDEQTITLSATRDRLINNRPWFDEIANGLLDHAEIRRERVFAPDWNSPPVGSVILFDGIVSTIDSLTATQCQLKVKSYLSLLNQPMPRNSWQTSCLHTLFDAGCKLSKAAYQVVGVVGAGSTVNTLNWGGATSGVYWQGMISFTSGPNMGLSRTIKLATGSQLMLHLPLPWMPVAGDLFFAYPGCDKTYLTCQNRFNNTANNRSYPYIPSATLSI